MYPNTESKSKDSHNKICIIYNSAQLYREGIWEELSNSDTFDFDIFCDYTKKYGVKQIDKKKIIGFNKKDGHLKIYPIIKNLYAKNILIWQKKSLRLMMSKKYSIYIILGDAYCLSNWVLLVLSKLLNKKTIVWTHGLYGKERLIIKYIRLSMIKLSSAALIYNQYSTNIISKYINQKKLFVVNNSLNHISNTKELNKLISNESNEKSDIFTLCFSGRLTKRKKLYLAIKAVHILKKEGIIVKLYIVGGGSEKQNLISLAKNLGVDKAVIFKGELYGSETNKIIFNSDLSISPGHVGLFAIHSMSFGTPVLTHNNFKRQSPEFEAIIPKMTGDFFLENNVHDLVKKIKFWYNKSDKILNRENCLRRVDKFYTPNYQKKIIEKSINYVKKN